MPGVFDFYLASVTPLTHYVNSAIDGCISIFSEEDILVLTRTIKICLTLSHFRINVVIYRSTRVYR